MMIFSRLDKIPAFDSGLGSVALLVARRTDNRKVVRSMPANVVCVSQVGGNRLG